jgi:RNA polymerase sigma-70 factor (ECF subfamily)
MATGEFDLEQCVQQVRQQNQDAARALVEHLYPLVIRIVRCHLPRRMAEEDLTQEIFVKLFYRLDQYVARAGVPFEHWVSRLAVRTCLDALRSEGRRPELRWSDLSPEEATWLEFIVNESEAPQETSATGASEIVEKLLAQLSPANRLVISQLDLQQKSVKEVAQLTGMSPTLVKVRAFRARRKLRALAEKMKGIR